MRLIGKIPFLIYVCILIAAGTVAYFLLGDKIVFAPVDMFKISLRIDAGINDQLVEWNIEDSDITSEYRKEIKSGEQIWVVVNKDIRISKDVLPADYQEVLTKTVYDAGGNVYRNTIKGNRFIFESGVKKEILNRLIFTFIRIQNKDAYYAAIIIDDVGYNKGIIEPFLKLGIPLTFAILPQEHFSSELAEYIHRSGGEIIIHMPLEPKDYPKVNPGNHALLLRMSEEEIREKFYENLYSLPYAVGISNHMGSRFMEDQEKLEIFMSCVSTTGLFFLDSRTTSVSLVPAYAKEMGIKQLINDVFLDAENDPRHIEQQVRLLANRAKKMKTAIGIGHVQNKHTAVAIKKSLRFYKYQNIEFVTLSEILNLSQKNK